MVVDLQGSCGERFFFMLSVNTEQEINENKSVSYLEQAVHAVVVHLAQGIVGLIDPLWNDGVYCSLKKYVILHL